MANKKKTKSNWQNHFSIVVADIKSVEGLGKKDLFLKVRLFELYGEKLSLLIERESEFRIKFLEKGDSKSLDKLVWKQKKTLKSLEKIASQIERETKDRKILTKINYYKSLNYSTTKDLKNFYKYIKIAERLNSDESIAYKIHTKLAEYHYNERQYKDASKYYKKLLNNKKNGWLTKHYYNLAWSELKLNNFDMALTYLKHSYVYENKKGYLRIGYQLVDSILLFHAYAKKTSVGIAYIDNKNLGSFKNYLKFLHYVFENGEKRDVELVINRIQKIKVNQNQSVQLLSKKVLIYRNSKKFSKLHKTFVAFRNARKQIRWKDVAKKDREELVLAINSYTGYLQELVKSEGLISEKKRKKFIKYISYNFSVLRYVNKKESLKYFYYEGETYFAVGQNKKASLVYTKGIKFTRKSKNKSKFLIKVYDSLFKSLERQTKPSRKQLVYTYKSYLSFFPKSDRSNIVHQRLINLYKEMGSERKVLSALRVYHKAYPKEIKIQKNYYKLVLNKYIDGLNASALISLKKIIDKGFLGFSKKESSKIRKAITEIYFSEYDDMAKKGQYREAISGFNKLFLDVKSKYALRVDSLRKKMFYENQQYFYSDLTKSLMVANKLFNQKYKKRHQEEFLFFTQNICLGDFQENCFNLLTMLLKNRNFKIPNVLKTLHFKLAVIKSKSLNEVYTMAKTEEQRNYLFKILSSRDSNFKSGLYKKLIKTKSIRNIVNSEVRIRSLRFFLPYTLN